MSLDDYHFDERDKKMLEAVLDGVKGIIKPIEKNLKRLVDKLNETSFFKEPFVYSESPKKITESGRKFLEENNIGIFLNELEQSQLLSDSKLKQYKNKKDEEIFIFCFNLVEKYAKKKVFDLVYNNNISKEQCTELLALALLEEIKKRMSQ